VCEWGDLAPPHRPLPYAPQGAWGDSSVQLSTPCLSTLEVSSIPLALEGGDRAPVVGLPDARHLTNFGWPPSPQSREGGHCATLSSWCWAPATGLEAGKAAPGSRGGPGPWMEIRRTLRSLPNHTTILGRGSSQNSRLPRVCASPWGAFPAIYAIRGVPWSASSWSATDRAPLGKINSQAFTGG
jgi:hypothetical protein